MEKAVFTPETETDYAAILIASKGAAYRAKPGEDSDRFVGRVRRSFRLDFPGCDFELTFDILDRELHDEEKPEHLFSTTWTTLLTRIVSGELDAREIAWNELRQRGFDETGKWVGFGNVIEKPF